MLASKILNKTKKSLNKSKNFKKSIRLYTVQATVQKVTLDPYKKVGYVPYAFSKEYKQWMKQKVNEYEIDDYANSYPERAASKKLQNESIFPVSADSVFEQGGQANSYFLNTVRLARLAGQFVNKVDSIKSAELEKNAWQLYLNFRRREAQKQDNSVFKQEHNAFVGERDKALKAALGSRWILAKYVDSPLPTLGERFAKSFLKGLNAKEQRLLWTQVLPEAKSAPSVGSELTMDQFFNRPQNVVDGAKGDLEKWAAANKYSLGNKDATWNAFSYLSEPKPASFSGAKSTEVSLGQILPIPAYYDGAAPLSQKAPVMNWLLALQHAFDLMSSGKAPNENMDNLQHELLIKLRQKGDSAPVAFTQSPAEFEKDLRKLLDETNKEIAEAEQQFYKEMKGL